MLQNIEEETIKMGLKMKPRTGKMVSPEAHLDFLTKHEEYEREKIYQSCRWAREKGVGGADMCIDCGS